MILDYIKYLGAPYKFNGDSIEEGFDCMNICLRIAKDRGIKMHNINHSHTTQNSYYSMMGLKDDKNLFEKVQVQPDVLVVFKIAGRVSHVGYMLNEIDFIHIMEGCNVAVERITDPSWEKRLVGFYKYTGE